MRTETTVQNKGKSHIPTSGDDEDEHIQLKRTSFSGKKKKDLLKAKRKIKEARRQTALRNDNDERTRFYEDFHGIESTIIKEPTKARNNLKCSKQDLGAETGLLSVFQKESDLDVAERKKDARIQYCTISPGPFGIAIDDANKMQSIQMPIRPQWNAGDTRSEADAREKSYFETYVKLLHGLNEKQLNPFEMNLEVWRQLWRVVERSDILLVVVDIRFPRLNFPRAFYELLKHQSTSEVLGKDHIKADTPDLNASNCSHATPRKLIGSTEKSMVIVLNKVDLISRDVADKWLDWFEEEYAGVTVLCMSSLPSENDSPFRDNKATGTNNFCGTYFQI